MELTPMMQQYLAAKEQHPDNILFFRLGDFYEMFFDDAKLAAKELGLTLTSRSGNKDKTPMCGVPYHAAETYINKLVSRGYKVAIAEQIGDPKAKGLTKREIIKIITPGTVLSEAALKDAQNNYIALVYEKAAQIILAGADISTGECFYGIYDGSNRLQMLLDELYRLAMPELLVVGKPSFNQALHEFTDLRLPSCAYTELAAITGAVDDRIIQHFDAANRPDNIAAKEAVATLLDYLHSTVMTDLTHLNKLTYLDASENLVVDTYTLRNLEITRNLRDGGKKDTLLAVLDFTETAMGSRLLKKWLEYPLLSIVAIDRRLDAVEELTQNIALRGNIRKDCKEIHDFERLLTRIEVGTANARDLIALKVSLKCLPQIQQDIAGVKAEILANCRQNIKSFTDLVDLLQRSLIDEPGISLRDGGIIKSGYNAELDEYRRIAHDSKAMLQEIEEREKQATGIKTLKIGYNKVFGYYIEVRNSGKDLVPERYIRKQTLANAERYITEELKEFETKILGAQEKIVNIEYNLFTEVRETIKTKLAEIQATAHEIAIIDVLTSLAEAAAAYNYVRPRMAESGEISILDGRHPLVERILTRDLFVPNDTKLNHKDCEILKYATKNSLVILDEIGRGTSTFDGMSIARAVIEHIEQKIHAKTLFATHYHELTDLANDKIKNFCVAVKEKGTQVAFLRRITPGAADKSYGIHVARLAGLPKNVTKRAEIILQSLENGSNADKVLAENKAASEKNTTAPVMGSLFTSNLSSELLKLDIMTMTPIEALNELYKLQAKAKEEAGTL